MCWCTHKHVRPHTVTTQSHSAPCRPLLSSWSFIKRGFRQNKWDWEWGSSGEGGIAFLIKRGEKRKGARCHRLSAFEEKNIYLIHRIPLLLVSPSLSWLSYCVQRRTRAHSHCRALRLVFIVKCNMSIVTFQVIKTMLNYITSHIPVHLPNWQHVLVSLCLGGPGHYKLSPYYCVVFSKFSFIPYAYITSLCAATEKELRWRPNSCSLVSENVLLNI